MADLNQFLGGGGAKIQFGEIKNAAAIYASAGDNLSDMTAKAYLDIPIGAVDLSKALPVFEGAAGYASSYSMTPPLSVAWTEYHGVPGYVGFFVPRLMNPSTLRVSWLGDADSLIEFTGRWFVIGG